jgi:hypothetical protein
MIISLRFAPTRLISFVGIINYGAIILFAPWMEIVGDFGVLQAWFAIIGCPAR